MPTAPWASRASPRASSCSSETGRLPEGEPFESPRKGVLGDAGRIGVLGGTFNPVHRGHLHAAGRVCEALELARMLFLPAADPPLKRDGADPLAPAALRMAWVEQAVEAEPRFEACGLELERSGPSFTVDTMRILGERLAPRRAVFVIGCDAFRELGSWHEPGLLLTLCDFAVMTRPPSEGDLRSWIPDALLDEFELAADGGCARHRGAGTRIDRVPIDALDISATEVRRRIRAGQSADDLLPEGLARVVIESGVYAAKDRDRSTDGAHAAER